MRKWRAPGALNSHSQESGRGLGRSLRKWCAHYKPWRSPSQLGKKKKKKEKGYLSTRNSPIKALGWENQKAGFSTICTLLTFALGLQEIFTKLAAVWPKWGSLPAKWEQWVKYYPGSPLDIFTLDASLCFYSSQSSVSWKVLWSLLFMIFHLGFPSPFLSFWAL